MSFFPLTKPFSKPLKSSVKHSRKSSKRGASEIIGSLILLGVTISGALLIFTLLSTNDIVDFATERQSLDPNVLAKLKLTGYDTRDADALYNLTNLDNLIGTSTTVPDYLCTTCGVANEFIILKFRNPSGVLVAVGSININEEEHTFDSAQSTTSSFTALTDLPASGKFIIISGSGTSGIKQELASTLPEGSEKRIVIRLSESITPATSPDGGIALNSNIRVIINTSAETTQLLLVPAGSLI